MSEIGATYNSSGGMGRGSIACSHCSIPNPPSPPHPLPSHLQQWPASCVIIRRNWSGRKPPTRRRGALRRRIAGGVGKPLNIPFHYVYLRGACSSLSKYYYCYSPIAQNTNDRRPNLNTSAVRARRLLAVSGATWSCFHGVFKRHLFSNAEISYLLQ